MSRKIDFLIIGGGLSGCALHFELTKRDKKAVIIDQKKENSASRVAAGLINPVTGRQYALTWRAKEFFDKIAPFYQELEGILKTRFYTPLSIFRIPDTEGEQNLILTRVQENDYKEFAQYVPQSNDFPLGKLQITKCGWLNTVPFLTAYRNYTLSKNEWIDAQFDINEINKTPFQYDNLEYEQLIFCQGVGGAENPFFNHLPLKKNKGQLMVVHAPNLKLVHILIGKVFIVPIENDNYWVGSTYEHQFKDDKTNDFGLNDLKRRFELTVNTPYKVIKQFAGIRPTVHDRKPLMGTSEKYNHIHILNGMGSKAVSMLPKLVEEFADYLIHKTPLLPEININRFE